MTCNTTETRVTGAQNAQAQNALPAAATPKPKPHDAARGFAQRSGGGEVRDHRKDNNNIRNTDTVGKRDPYPPKG